MARLRDMTAAASGVSHGYTGATLVETVAKKAQSSADPWALDAADFSAGYLYLLFVGATTQVAPTGVTGVTGCTFAELAHQADDQGEGSLWWGVPASNQTGATISVDWAGATAGGTHLVKVSHQGLVAADPFTQYKTRVMGDGPDNTHPTVSFDAGATKAVICFANCANSTPTTTAVTVGATMLNEGDDPKGITCWYDATTAFLQTSAITKSSGVNWDTIGVEMK